MSTHGPGSAEALLPPGVRLRPAHVDDAMALLLGAEIDRPKPADEESEERMLRMMLEAQGRG